MVPAGGSHAGDELLGTRATWLYLVIVFASLVICTFTWSPDTPILVARDHPAVWVAIHLSALVCFTVFCLASALTTRRGLSDIESRNREPERVIENANRAKHASSRFLSTISHELRTPLNGILGMTQFLNLDRLPPHPGEQRGNDAHLREETREDSDRNLGSLQAGSKGRLRAHSLLQRCTL